MAGPQTWVALTDAARGVADEVRSPSIVSRALQPKRAHPNNQRHANCFMPAMIDWTRQFGHAALSWTMAGISVLSATAAWLWNRTFGATKSPALVRAETKRRHKKILRRMRGLE